MSTSLGDNCIVGGSSVGGNLTAIFNKNVVQEKGIIKSWCIYNNGGASSGKIKIFRTDGTTFFFVRDGQTSSLGAGLNSNLPTNTPVDSGDLVGLFLSAGAQLLRVAPGGSNVLYRRNGEDVNTDISISSYLYSSSVVSVPYQVQIFPPEVSAKKEILGNISKLGYTKKGAFINKASGKGASFT